MSDNTEEKNTTESKVVKESEALKRVIAGQNDVFEKDYDFSDLHPDFVFTIKIKYPNFLESARVMAQYERYLGGMGSFMEPFTRRAFMAMSVIKICGVDVPDLFKDETKVYNLDILARIEEDFVQWTDTFCG